MQKNNSSFCFEYGTKGKVSEYIGNLNKNESYQEDDIDVMPCILMQKCL